METDTVYRGDVTDTLKNIDGSSIDLIVTSPPYWGLRDYEADDQIGLEDDFRDYVDTIANVCDGLSRVLKDTGSLYINIGDTYNTDSIVRASASAAKMSQGDDEYDEYHTVEGREKSGRVRRKTDSEHTHKSKLFIPHRVAIELTRRGWIVRNDIPWVKKGGGVDNATDRYRKRHEKFFFATLSEDYYFEPNGNVPYDVFENAKSSFKGDHYATYPPELIEPIIRRSCPNDGVVFDPFCGSGSTLVAASRTDREWLGVELREDYAKMAETRAKDAKSAGLDKFI